MTLIFRTIIWLLEFVILVGIAGGLVDMTRDMRKEAYKAQRTGLISLTRLNHEIVGK